MAKGGGKSKGQGFKYVVSVAGHWGKDKDMYPTTQLANIYKQSVLGRWKECSEELMNVENEMRTDG